MVDAGPHLLSSFMQSFSSGIVAKTRPHLVHVLCRNDMSQVSIIFNPPSSRLLLLTHLQRSGCQILNRGPALGHRDNRVNTEWMAQKDYKDLRWFLPSSICCSSQWLSLLESAAAWFQTPRLGIDRNLCKIPAQLHLLIVLAFQFYTGIGPDVDIWHGQSL